MLAQLYKDKIQLKKEMGILNQTFQEEKARLNSSIRNINKFIEMESAGLDLEKIKIAEKTFRFQGHPNKSSERIELINDAISELTNGGKKLTKTYFGIKNYAHFGDQRVDCDYGYSPAHGLIVFRFGLIESDTELTPELIEAGIYYLHNWQKIHEAKQAP